MNTRSSKHTSIFKNPIILLVAVTILIIGGGIFFLSKNDSSQSTDNAVVKAKSGVVASDFTLPSTTGGTISLSDYKGRENVLLYFNEGLSCDPCMQQIPELQRTLPVFQKMHVQLLSIMYDSVDELKSAQKQYHITTPMLSYHDNPSKIDADYTLTANSMAMHNRAGHTFVLVNTDGKIVWRKDYWPGQGMMVQGGVMFVNGSEVIQQVKNALGNNYL